jgi:hypothetical protein
MVGAIRRRDILAHPLVTIHCFGFPLFLKALVAGRDKTFLSLVTESAVFARPAAEVPELLERCIKLELRAQQMYDSLAERFTDQEPVREFFETLAHQEQDHAEMLELCRELVSHGGWLEEHFRPWSDAVPRLERQMDEAEASAEALERLADALRLVITIEGSEINQVFGGAIAATDSPFVRSLRAFQTAEDRHLSYICDMLPKLDPELASECMRLRTTL